VDAVWLTAESLGDADPALEAYPDRPAVFVFDARRLGGWRLSRKRLVFLVECLSDLATRREVELHVGDPVETLAGRRLAATTTPVPGWRAISKGLDLADVLPWPWLVPPHPGPVASFSAWRKVIDWPQTQSAQGVLRFDGAG
jgi:deoxyribodipyrimidine photo-lyase